MGRQLGHRPDKGAKVIHHRLINQHVSVCKKEYSFLRAGLPQAPYDLKRGECFSRAGRHYQQEPVLPFGNRLNCCIHRIGLVVARRFAGIVIALKDDLCLLIGQAFPGLVFHLQLVWGWKLVQPDFCFHGC